MVLQNGRFVLIELRLTTKGNKNKDRASANDKVRETFLEPFFLNVSQTASLAEG